jgi:hypothetical protein
MIIVILVIASVSLVLTLIWGKRNRDYAASLQKELQIST